LTHIRDQQLGNCPFTHSEQAKTQTHDVQVLRSEQQPSKQKRRQSRDRRKRHVQAPSLAGLRRTAVSFVVVVVSASAIVDIILQGRAIDQPLSATPESGN
jgi:hypothetical protein